MSVRPGMWGFLAVGLLVCLVVGSFLSYYGFYSRYQNIGFSTEARLNPFLAAEKYLERSGESFEVERSFSSLDELPSTDTLLVILASRDGISQNRRDNLKSWVNDGGTALLLATEIFDDETSSSKDQLLDELGVRLYSLDGSDNNSKGFSVRVLEQMFDELLEHDEENYNLIDHPSMEQDLRIRFNDDYYLYDTSGNAYGYSSDEDFEHFLSYELGEGVIFVLSDVDFLTNTRIDDLDHAFLLSELTSDRDGILMLTAKSSPSIFTMIWRYAMPIVLSLLILTAMWLWRSSWRLGAIERVAIHSNRKLSEHIDAGARIRWQQSQEQMHLKALRQEVSKAAAMRIPNFNNQSDAIQISLLAEIAGLNKEKVQFAMSAESDHKETKLLEMVQILQILRKKL